MYLVNDEDLCSCSFLLTISSYLAEFSSACNYPITCSLFYDDDDPAVCVPKMIGKMPYLISERVCLN